MKLKIKKGDTVKIIAGSDKGKSGAVLELNPRKLKVKVQGVRIQTKVDKKENQFVKTEGFIDYSNVALFDSAPKKKKKAPAKKAATKKAAATAKA